MVGGTPSRWNNRDNVSWASPLQVIDVPLPIQRIREGVPANIVSVKVVCGSRIAKHPVIDQELSCKSGVEACANNPLGGQLNGPFRMFRGYHDPPGRESLKVLQTEVRWSLEWSRLLNSSIVTGLTYSNNVTPLKIDRRVTGCKEFLGSLIVNACVWSVGSDARNFGKSLTITSFTRHCIGQRRWWSRCGMWIAW